MRPLLMVPRGVLLAGLFSLAALWPTAMEAQLWPASLRGDKSAQEQQAAAQEKQESGDKKQPAKPAPPKPEYPKFADVTKEHKQIFGPEGKPGFFPLYYHEKKDQLLGVVPRGMIGQNFLLATSISGGSNFAGYMWEHRVVNWVEMDKKLVLIEPELRYVKPQGNTPIKDVIDRTYTDRILLSTPIITKRGADPVIDLGSIFKSDFARVGPAFGGSMNAALSRWAKYKVFPDNVELAVDGAFMRGNLGGTRGRVHYSVVKLPKNDYKPREADDRIGYFLTALKDWTVEHKAPTIFKRYIHRWDVRKAEPGEAVSDVDPNHQIVFYIEKTVPVKYRRYVREGILEWNKAFEKAGFRNAVKVEQQTETLHADKDPEDVRYAFFRWIVSGVPFAMGPSLTNPLTGQILDADILFDDSMVRYWDMQYARFSGTTGLAQSDPQLQAFLKKYPEWAFIPQQQRLLGSSARYAGVNVNLDPEVQRRLSEKHGFCTFAQGLAREMALATAFFQATGRENLREEYVGQYIKHVTSHEVGHTLGLRHNFKASSWKSIDEILANTDPDVPTSGSVMDYTPAMLHPDSEKQGPFVSQTLGPYDEWAIQYGYALTHKGSEHKSEKDMLQAIAKRVAEEGLAYATDEDMGFFGTDPLVNAFDNGDDLVAFAKHRIEMVRRLQEDMADWAVKDGESYYRLRQAFDMVLSEYGRVAAFAAGYVGGQYINRDHKGDPDARPPIQIVPAVKQREAMTLLIETLFSDQDFSFDPDLLNRLAAGRWSHWESDAYDGELDYPIHDRIAATQSGALFRLLNPVTLGRVYDAQLKVPADEDVLTIPELLGTLTDSIWSELDGQVGSEKRNNRQPFVSSVRRNLQRQHLRSMLNVVLSRPGRTMAADIHAVVCLKLQQLSEKMGTVLQGGNAGNLDDFTRAHLDSSRSRIDRALDARYRIDG